ncbi:MAG: carboxypeptidase-like regulatory domain-containing protein [Bacteroidales bacterium]|nr:carboxypeptidase-like regulatory domain-containing protein [Bacteroidales bacterium]
MFILFLIGSVGLSAQFLTFTINGSVRETGNGESLVGCSVTEFSGNKGTASDAYGFYGISLPKGKVGLPYPHLGYETCLFDFELNKNATPHISLERLTSC